MRLFRKPHPKLTKLRPRIFPKKGGLTHRWVERHPKWAVGTGVFGVVLSLVLLVVWFHHPGGVAGNFKAVQERTEASTRGFQIPSGTIPIQGEVVWKVLPVYEPRIVLDAFNTLPIPSANLTNQIATRTTPYSTTCDYMTIQMTEKLKSTWGGPAAYVLDYAVEGSDSLSGCSFGFPDGWYFVSLDGYHVFTFTVRGGELYASNYYNRHMGDLNRVRYAIPFVAETLIPDGLEDIEPYYPYWRWDPRMVEDGFAPYYYGVPTVLETIGSRSYKWSELEPLLHNLYPGKPIPEPYLLTQGQVVVNE